MASTAHSQAARVDRCHIVVIAGLLSSGEEVVLRGPSLKVIGAPALLLDSRAHPVHSLVPAPGPGCPALGVTSRVRTKD